MRKIGLLFPWAGPGPWPNPRPPNDGLAGDHTTDEAEGAMKNGTRVRKTQWRDGDTQAVGATARIVGSFAVPAELLEKFGFRYMYFVEWDATRGVAVLVAENALETVS